MKGLCASCNQVAGKSDPSLAQLFDCAARRTPTSLARGAAANSMLSGLFALAPQLHTVLPVTAKAVKQREPTDDFAIEFSLRLARRTSGLAFLCGSTFILDAEMLLNPGEASTEVLAAVFFRDLAYALVPRETPGTTADWIDISAWAISPLDEQTDVSRELSALPAVRSFAHGRDMFMTSHEHTVFMEGRTTNSRSRD